MGMYVWEIWEYMCGKYGNVCVGNMGMYVWEIWECMGGKYAKHIK